MHELQTSRKFTNSGSLLAGSSFPAHNSSLILFSKATSKTLQGERAVHGQVLGLKLIQVMRTGFVEHQGSKEDKRKAKKKKRMKHSDNH